MKSTDQLKFPIEEALAAQIELTKKYKAEAELWKKRYTHIYSEWEVISHNLWKMENHVQGTTLGSSARSDQSSIL